MTRASSVNESGSCVGIERLDKKQRAVWDSIAVDMEAHAQEVVTSALVTLAGLTPQQAGPGLQAYAATLHTQDPEQQLLFWNVLASFMRDESYGFGGFRVYLPTPAPQYQLFCTLFTGHATHLTARQVAHYYTQTGILRIASQLAAHPYSNGRNTPAVAAIGLLRACILACLNTAVPDSPALWAHLSGLRAVSAPERAACVACERFCAWAAGPQAHACVAHCVFWARERPRAPR